MSQNWSRFSAKLLERVVKSGWNGEDILRKGFLGRENLVHREGKHSTGGKEKYRRRGGRL